jgi:hypothetical protein
MIEKLLANPYAGDGTVHPDMHLIYIDEICGLFKLAGLSEDGIKKKVFHLSFLGKALTWYRLLDDARAWDWNRLKLEFHQKFYPMHLVHRDRNYIYNFWPREGESITQAWGRLKYMLHTCPNHELSREIIIQNFYARLSHNDQSMLDTSSTGSFMKRTIEFRWDLLERIKHNSEDWEIDKGKESGINLECDSVKSFMETDAFHKFSTKYGLDSEIVATFCESFAAHVDLPEEKYFKYHPPIELNEEPVSVKEETIVYNVDPVVPTAYIEKPPFPVRIKEHAKASTVVNKSNIRTPRPFEQIKVKPNIAMVKDLLVDDIDGHVIYFCDEAARIVKPVRNERDMLDKDKPVVGMPVVSVKIGDHCYHGLCDMGASVSAIPFSLYQEVMHDIAPVEIEDIDITIKLANRDTITPLGIVGDVEVLCCKIKYPTDFLVLGSLQDNFCPIIFGRP